MGEFATLQGPVGELAVGPKGCGGKPLRAGRGRVRHFATGTARGGRWPPPVLGQSRLEEVGASAALVWRGRAGEPIPQAEWQAHEYAGVR